MRTKQFFRVVIVAVAVSGASLTATAQQQASQTSAPQKKEAKPAPAKSAKVWTGDDLTSLRSPADTYAQQQQQEVAAAAATATASAKQQSAAKTGNPADPTPGRVSGWNIKTPNDAQKAIDWDDRDIATQRELAANLQKQLDAAPLDQKARLQKAVDERLQIIAGTQKDRDVIAAQKEKLEKKPAAGNNGPSAPPQSQ